MTHAGEKDWFYCERCDVTYLMRGNETAGHREDTDVECKNCGAVLGHLR